MSDFESREETKSDKEEQRLIDDLFVHATGSLYPQSHVVSETNIPTEFIEPGKAVQNFFKFRDELKKTDIEPEQLKQLEKEYIEHLTWRWSYVKKVFNQQIINGWIITVFVVITNTSWYYLYSHSSIYSL